MNRILITGGKGYLGRRMSQALVENSNFEVSVTSRNSNPILELPSVDVIQV
jgi:nucleoside-diphosphate-sugar epimerase